MTTNTALTIARPALAEVPGARRRPNPRPVPRAAVVAPTVPAVAGPAAAARSAEPSHRPASSHGGRAGSEASGPGAGRCAAAPPSRATLVRRRLVVGALTVALAGGALAVGFQVGHAGAELEGPPPAAPVYVVQPGDTLWAIAERLAPEVDAQRAVAALVRSAGGAALTPGQRIVVPAALR